VETPIPVARLARVDAGELSGDGAPRLNRRLPLWVERPPKLLVTRPRAPSNTLTAAIPSKRCQIVATASMRTPSMFV
jgi:hypothetical protein